MKVVVFVDPIEGGTSVFYPSHKNKLEDETEDVFLERAIAKDIPAGIVTHIIEDTELPSDRYFRNAWEWED